MSNVDSFIEMLRLAEQAGTVMSANMTDTGTCLVIVKDRCGNSISFVVRKEETK